MGFWSLVQNPIGMAAAAAIFFFENFGHFQTKSVVFPNQKSNLRSSAQYYFGTEVCDFGVWFPYPIACAAMAATFLGKFRPFSKI